jgi:hypothetical protein
MQNNPVGADSDLSINDRELSIGLVHYNMEAYGEN